MSDSDYEDGQSKKYQAVGIDKLSYKFFLTTTMKLYSIWTNLSSKDLTSTNEEEKMESESHLTKSKTLGIQGCKQKAYLGSR